MLYHDGKPAERHRVSAREEIEDLEPLQWCLFEGHIYFHVEDGRLPQSYELTYTGLPVGITLYEVHECSRPRPGDPGVSAGWSQCARRRREAVLSGLNCRGNGRSGISVGGASRVRHRGMFGGQQW